MIRRGSWARRPRHGGGLMIALLSAGLLAGCVTESVERGDPSVMLDGGPGRSVSGDRAVTDASGRGSAGREADGRLRARPIPGFEDRGPLGTRVPVFTAGVRAEIQPRGAIGFDEQTLPLVSPDGMRLAVPAGLPPEWSAILAESGSLPPDGGVMIHDLSSPAAEPPRPMMPVREPVLLGRAVNDAGFLVEAPRPDGSRWIGLADWETGSIEWLVTGTAGEINAFGTLGPDGWLAWCRQRPGEERFTLVMRGPDGTERELPSRAGSWLMPRFALDGSLGLFALVLRDDALDAVHLDPSAGAAVMATLRRTALVTDGADVGTAYQAMAADVAMVSNASIGDPPPAVLYFVHPAHGRTAAWDPSRPLPVLLDARSFAATAALDDARYCMVSGPEYLFRRAITEPRDRIRVIAGMHVARPTVNPDRSYVLLQPTGALLGVTILRFEPITETIGGDAESGG